MAKNKTKSSVDYYLALDYPITLRKLAPEDGGGYMASIPDLGSDTFVADGETPAEALDALEELRKVLIPRLVERGVRLPEPSTELRNELDIGAYSGALMLRVPSLLHARLAAESKRSRCSLNKLATELLAEGLVPHAALDRCVTAVREAVTEEVRQALEAIRSEYTEGIKRSAWSPESLPPPAAPILPDIDMRSSRHRYGMAA